MADYGLSLSGANNVGDGRSTTAAAAAVINAIEPLAPTTYSPPFPEAPTFYRHIKGEQPY